MRYFYAVNQQTITRIAQRKITKGNGYSRDFVNFSDFPMKTESICSNAFGVEIRGMLKASIVFHITNQLCI